MRYKMPIYEYTCSACESQFELLVRGDTKPACPTCESTKIEKEWSVPAAPSSSSNSLPMAGGCGKPACQTGCQFE
ncbi:MAG: FmdB family zinc ribbon protein [Planctomycetota bacterium]